MAEEIYEQQTKHFTHESISLVAIFEARKNSTRQTQPLLAFDAKGTTHQWFCSNNRGELGTRKIYIKK